MRPYDAMPWNDTAEEDESKVIQPTRPNHSPPTHNAHSNLSHGQTYVIAGANESLVADPPLSSALPHSSTPLPQPSTSTLIPSPSPSAFHPAESIADSSTLSTSSPPTSSAMISPDDGVDANGDGDADMDAMIAELDARQRQQEEQEQEEEEIIWE